jgi:hypothetical protein
MSAKSERQLKYELFRESLIQSGLDRKLFPINFQGKDIKSLDVNLRKIKEDNPELKIMLGDINFYSERVLLCTAKKGLKDTHKVFSANTRRYWCEYIGVDPRVESNQGQYFGKEKLEESAKSYGTNCLLTVEQAIKMICYLLRFRLSVGHEAKTPLDEFQDLGTVVFLDLLQRGRAEVIWALNDSSLGKSNSLAA